MTGQIPIYYAHKNTGKPATPGTPATPGASCLSARRCGSDGASCASARAATRSLKDVILACERRHIAEVLAEHGGNRARSAVALGLTRQGLVGKIARLGIG